MDEMGDRTEQATPRRREKAREEGQVARSRELSAIAAVGGIMLVMWWWGGRFTAEASNMTAGFLGMSAGVDPIGVMRAAGIKTLFLMMPFLCAATVFAFAASIAQGGFILKPFKPDFSGINPLEGFKRLFSVNGLMEFLKSLMKFFAGACLVYYVVKNTLPLLPGLMTMDARGLGRASAGLVMKAAAYGFFLFLVFGVVDYFITRWRFERSLRMSKQDIKDEMKESEGSPEIKARIRAIQREIARRRMMQEVPKASVVITNPTHLSVALKYDGKSMSAPSVVAKGADAVAMKIREIARKNGVPMVEDKPLARALYKVELGESIPSELYRAVAKILAYIYRLRGVAA